MESILNLLLLILNKFGWLGNWLFLLIALIECVPFAGGLFPGGTMIYLAAILSAQGHFTIYEVMGFAAVGAVLGDYLGYSLGRWGGLWLAQKKLISPELMARAEEFFQKYGNKSILWGRFIGPLRAVIPFVAGASRMKQGSFLLWNIIGAAVWAVGVGCLGYFSGNIIAILIKKWSSGLSWLFLAIVVSALIYWLLKKHGQSRREYFSRQSLIFTEKLFSGHWFSVLDARYPVVTEISRSGAKPEKVFSIFWLAAILLSLYILTILLDLF